MRRLAGRTRRRQRSASASATGDAAARLQAIARELQTAFAPLQELFESLQEADLRPTPAVEAAAADALKRVDGGFDAGTRRQIATAGTQGARCDGREVEVGRRGHFAYPP